MEVIFSCLSINADISVEPWTLKSSRDCRKEVATILLCDNIPPMRNISIFTLKMVVYL